MMPLSDVLLADDVFLPWFPNPETFETWFAIIRAMEGLKLSPKQLETYTALTGNTVAPTKPARETWIVAGRRAAKTRMLAMQAVWKATSFDYARSKLLAPGERAVASIAAENKKQARVAFRYVEALVKGVPDLRAMVTGETQESFDFSNGAAIEVQAANFRGVRGRSYCFFGVDEAAFLRDEESASPDTELFNAVEPGLVTFPNSLFWGSSSPWGKKGLVYDKYVENWGKNTDVLVFKGTSKQFNPTLTDAFIQKMVNRDAAAAQSEWFGEFRDDIAAFITRETVMRCLPRDEIFERPPVSGISYFGFTDPSGGSKDEMTLAIGHSENGRVILDALRAVKPPFSPEAVVAEFCGTLKSYGLSSVTGDRYGAEWPRERFREHGVSYRLSEMVRSDLYLAMLPCLNAQTVELLHTKDGKLVNQIAGLERRSARSGKESIDHSPNSHDDLANAVAGVVAHLSTKREAAAPAFGTYGISRQSHPLVSRYGL